MSFKCASSQRDLSVCTSSNVSIIRTANAKTSTRERKKSREKQPAIQRQRLPCSHQCSENKDPGIRFVQMAAGLERLVTCRS